MEYNGVLRGTEFATFLRSGLDGLTQPYQDAINKYAAKHLSPRSCDTPNPAMSWHSGLSQFGNYVKDGLGYYASDARKITMDFDKMDEGFKQACELLKTPSLVNKFLIHNYTYAYDKEPEDEFRKPQDVFKSRWKEGWNKGDIADDCDGAAGFAHYVIMQADRTFPNQIVDEFKEGKRENIILCMYNKNSGHATNQHGKFTVDNWGLINHWATDPVTVGRDFIGDANWFSYYIFRNDRYEFIEGGDDKFYKTGISFADYISTTKLHPTRLMGDDKKRHAVLDYELLKGVIDSARKEGEGIEFKVDKIEALGFDSDAAKRVAQGLEMELKGNAPTPLRQVAERNGIRPMSVRVVA